MKRHILSIVCLVALYLTCTPLFAQKAPISWGDIPKADLAMTVYERDTSAAAVVLADYGELLLTSNTSEYICRFTHHKRVKILKKSGFGHADISIPFQHKNGYEKIIRAKAQVISPSGKVYPVSKKEMFEETINEYWSALKFSFPNVEVGSIFEYEYLLESGNIVELQAWDFQESIPVRHSELRTDLAAGFTYLYLFEGTDEMEKSEEDGVITFQGEATVKFSDNRFILENVPALVEEAYITTLKDYRARLRFQLNKVELPGVSKTDYLHSWEYIAKELLARPSFGEQFTRKQNYKKVLEAVQPLVVGKSTETEKAEAIYNFLAQRINWEGYYGIFVSEKLDNSFEKNKAVAAEANFMLLAVLRELDISADPVLISTRSHGKHLPKYPLLDQFNHVIVRAKLDGTYQLLDVNSPLRAMGYPRVNALNYKGWVVSEKPEWIDIESAKSSDVFMIQSRFAENGTLEGEWTAQFKGYSAFEEREKYLANPNAAYWQERLAASTGTAIIKDVKVEKGKENTETFRTDFSFIIADAAVRNGDYLYFSPVLYTGLKENPFKTEKRRYPVDFPYPLTTQYIFKLELPEGYAIEALPEAAKILLPNNGGTFYYSLAEKDGTLEIVSRFMLNQRHFTAYQYPDLKSFFGFVLEKHQEQVVLKKVNTVAESKD